MSEVAEAIAEKPGLDAVPEGPRTGEQDEASEEKESAETSMTGDMEWASWVEEVTQPIAGGAGEDPRYSDRFTNIKSEIDKLSGANFHHVVMLSREVLAEEGKDLRVAGYMLMGILFSEGIKALPDAMEVYTRILEQFGENCFPAKESAKLQAYNWLNSERFSGFISQLDNEVLTVPELERLKFSVDRLYKVASAKLGEQAGYWKSVNDWTSKALSEKKAAEEKLRREQKAQEEKMRQGASLDGPITESKANEIFGKIAAYYRDQKEFARAIGTLRAQRWGNLKTPPNENGQTRIPPLRQAALNELRTMQQNGEKPEVVLNQCESVFMEPGAQWNMDLQFIVHNILEGLKAEDALIVHQAEVSALIKRCPEIPELCYEGGDAFADPEAREWLEGLNQGDDDHQARVAGVAMTDEHKKMVKAAAQAVKNGSLLEGINILGAMPDENAREKFIKRLEEARLCVKAKQPEMGMTILEDMDREIEDRDLAKWEPALALDAWRLHAQAIKLGITKADVSQKASMELKLKEIHAAVCKTDLQEAVRMSRLTSKAKGAQNGR